MGYDASVSLYGTTFFASIHDENSYRGLMSATRIGREFQRGTDFVLRKFRATRFSDVYRTAWALSCNRMV